MKASQASYTDERLPSPPPTTTRLTWPDILNAPRPTMDGGAFLPLPETLTANLQSYC